MRHKGPVNWGLGESGPWGPESKCNLSIYLYTLLHFIKELRVLVHSKGCYCQHWCEQDGWRTGEGKCDCWRDMLMGESIGVLARASVYMHQIPFKPFFFSLNILYRKNCFDDRLIVIPLFFVLVQCILSRIIDMHSSFDCHSWHWYTNIRLS
jgi:hypothetical protein